MIFLYFRKFSVSFLELVMNCTIYDLKPSQNIQLNCNNIAELMEIYFHFRDTLSFSIFPGNQPRARRFSASFSPVHSSGVSISVYVYIDTHAHGVHAAHIQGVWKLTTTIRRKCPVTKCHSMLLFQVKRY